jgi:predicted permease
MLEQAIEVLSAVGAAWRALRRRPTFALLSTALLALGVGAVAAIFAVVNATLLRPLPYRDPEALYGLSGTEPVNGDSTTRIVLSWMQLARWRTETRAFAGIEGYTPSTMKLLGAGEPEPVNGAVVSAGLFDLLGWRPHVGRAFRRDEERPGNGVAIISDGLWKRRFGGEANVLGRVINVDDEPRTIVGVMPPGFSMLFQAADIWTPMLLNAEQLALRARMVAGIGRLRPGVTAAQGRADLAAINAELAAEQPNEYRFTGVAMVALRDSLFGAKRASLIVLLAAVVILLAVATVNTMSLSLADALARRMTTMTRLALGAAPARIVSLRLTQMAIIVVVATIAAIALGRLGLVALATVSPDAVAGFGRMSIDATVIAVAALTALLAGAFAGVPAALSEARVGVDGLAGGATKSIGATDERRRRDLLMGAQVALAVVLLIGAALLARNVKTLLGRPTGFTGSGVTVVELTFSRTTYTTKEQRALHAQRLLDAVHAIPGVEAAATLQTRFVLNETMQTWFEIDGQPADPGVQQIANIRHTTPEILKALRIRLLQGRGFATTDRMGSPPVAMVSASFAKRYWGTDIPIGKRIRRVSNEAPWMEVIGVVDDVSDMGAGVDVAPTLYVSYLQQNTATARPTIIIRATGSPSALFPAIRRAIWSVDANQTIDAITRLDDLMLRSAAQPRFAALVALLFAAGALLLVLSGIYAVTLYSVLQRTRELGVRGALGARPVDLLSTAMGRSMRPVLAGTAVGIAVAIPAGSAMRRALVDGMSMADAPLLGAVVVGLAVATALAAYIPARRALSISPALAMRD